jgi:AraC family transcriptional regulator
MQQEQPENGGPLEPFASMRKTVPFEAKATSERLSWTGLGVARYCAAPDSEFHTPIITHHQLFLFRRPAKEVNIVYEGVNRHVPPPAGTISLVPAGSPAHWRWSGRVETLLIFLDPKRIAQVAAETFDLDPARLAAPSLDAVNLPELRTVMETVDAELTVSNAGGPLVAESLANVLAVHLIRHTLAPRRPERGRDGMLSRGRLRAVVEYIESHLDTSPTLAEIATVAHLSPCHFARQFKAATGLPPHQFVIARRVERAKELLQGGGDLSVSQVALRTGFVDQSHLSYHFKRLVGVTPSHFHILARSSS